MKALAKRTIPKIILEGDRFILLSGRQVAGYALFLDREYDLWEPFSVWRVRYLHLKAKAA
jgi:hypothetical protein